MPSSKCKWSIPAHFTVASNTLWLLKKMLSITFDRSFIHQIDGETLTQNPS